MFDKIIELWAVSPDCARALTAAELARRASPQLRSLLLKVAGSTEGDAGVDVGRLDAWLAAHEGLGRNGLMLASKIKPVQTWTPQGGVVQDRRAWLLEGSQGTEPEHRTMPSTISSMPVIRTDRSRLSLSEKLEANAAAALDVHADVLALGVNPENMKQTRVVAEVASTAIKAKLHADVASMQARRVRVGPSLEELIEEAEARIAAIKP